MAVENPKKFLTVAPFKCAWRNDLRFQEAGRGCVAFEAFAHNDVTVVFREQVGGLHYHYRWDNSPHYTVIIGSNRNRRLKIQVDGKTVVDVAGVALCSSSAFQSYWISFCDGSIGIGTGCYPFQNLVLHWLHPEPNCSVQYVGLSSWDKHVGYRNVNVLPLTRNHISLWQHLDHGKYGVTDDGDEDFDDKCLSYEKWGLGNFLESWELSDVLFIVGIEERPVPAHAVILEACGNFRFNSSDDNVIRLRWVAFPVLLALLQYIYTGHTQVPEWQLNSLAALSLHFEVIPLSKQCYDAIERFKTNKRLFEHGKNVLISHPSCQPDSCGGFPFGVPVNMQRLKSLRSTCEYADLDVYIEGHGLVTRSHKIILSLWSIPFTKMFTNGMKESFSASICLKEVSAEAFKAMLDFMYHGQLVEEDFMVTDTSLLQLLLLADKYGVTLLHQECCKMLLECLSEDSVCPVLQVLSSVPSCRLIEETCKRKFAMHFDYCTTINADFVFLDHATFSSILQHPDLTVTSEERVLNAILCWGMQTKELHGWEEVDDILATISPDLLFKDRHGVIDGLLPLVRFPLMPHSLLRKLEKSSLSKFLYTLYNLVREAISHGESGLMKLENDWKFQHRRSSYKELQYICDGDNHGVIYFAGTGYGKHRWVNPVLAKRITIVASSPISRHTDPKALASRTFQGMSSAGARLEEGGKHSWWMVDIGQDHQLMCNYYSVRQDGSRSCIRSWNLQGSLDGKVWMDLRVHENDHSLCKPGQFGSWPITGPLALLPFRYFRIWMTGPSSDGSNPWSLCICFLELYGYFR